MPVIQWLQNVFENKKKQSDESRLYRKIDEQLQFASSEALTLGVEFELVLLDRETMKPVNKGAAIIAAAKSPLVKPESFEHMVEITTAIAKNVQDAERQLEEQIEKVTLLCQQQDLMLSGTGWPPTVKLTEVVNVPDKRYQRLNDERKILGARFGTLGMHVHLGMESAEQCIRFHNFFMHFMPHFIALSASAPFENGIETGLATIRPSITESLPVAGMPYNFENWQDYVNLCRAMFRAGSIQNLKDSWWDYRPCPRYGTLEIRICDMPATLTEAMAITAFIHSVAMWFREHQAWLDEMPRPNLWRMRENKWRAMRYGVDADLVLNNQGDTRPLRDDIACWIERITPFVQKNGYGHYMMMLKTMMERGNSARRQQAVWETTHDLTAVARFNCDEFAAGEPLWDDVASYGAEQQAENVRKAS